MSDSLSSLSQYWPILLAYLAGATPFGYIAGRMRGIDLRQHGSGNIGATNAIRVLGKPIGIAVFLCDAIKGCLPVYIALRVSDSSFIHIATAMAAILGHTYTFWLRFKGGKGVATTTGALLPILPWTLLAALITWIVTVRITRYVSVASIAAALVVPISITFQAWLSGRWDPVILCFGVILCALVIWKHRSNIARLRRGEENRIIRRSSSNPSNPS